MTPDFPRTASPCVARQYFGTLGKTANCQVAVSVHLVNEHASCAADWRLFCPQSWDDAALADPVAAARARRRREQARIPVKCGIPRSGGWRWRCSTRWLAPAAGASSSGSPAGGARPAVAADAGYGNNTTFRLDLEARGWQYALAVRGTTSAYASDAQPVTRSLGGGQGVPCPPTPPAIQPAPARHRQRGYDPAGDLAAGHQGHQRQP